MKFINMAFLLVYAGSVLSMEESLNGVAWSTVGKPWNDIKCGHLRNALDNESQKVIGDFNLRKVIKALAKNNRNEDLGYLFQKIEICVDIAATLNTPDQNGLSILHYALSLKEVNVKIIEVLLKNGANPNLALTKAYGQTLRGKNFLYPNWTAAHIAVRTNKPKDFFTLLKKYGTDFLHKDDEGWTPVRLAQHHNMKVPLEFFADERDPE